jgi:hypothetical protein
VYLGENGETKGVDTVQERGLLESKNGSYGAVREKKRTGTGLEADRNNDRKGKKIPFLPLNRII